MDFSHDPGLNEIAAKIQAGERLSFENGVTLYATDDLNALAKLADSVRSHRHGRVTYFNVNRHFNPTNVCYVDCKFCGFYRTPRQPDAYTHNIQDSLRIAGEAVREGATELHITGGLNTKLPFSYFTDLLSSLKRESTVNGRLSGDRLDERQSALYDLAWSSAEIAAARSLIDSAARVIEKPRGNADGFEIDLAAAYSAEAYGSVKSRLAARLADFGIPSARYHSLLEVAELESYRARWAAFPVIESIGARFQEGRGDAGESLLDEEHAIMCRTFRKFADETVAPLAEAIHREDLDIPDEILNPLRELGVFGLSIPQRFGGLQNDDHEDNMGMIVVTEALSRGSLGAAGSLITRPEILSRALQAGGTEAQKTTWLPRLAAGDPLCAVAVTEPDYGSDVAALRFSATRAPGGWRLNGTKTWLTFGGRAGVLLLLARTDPDLAKGHRGLSVFLVEKPSTPGHAFEHLQPGGGLMKGKAIATIGYRGMHSFEVFFEEYLIPDSALLGGEAGLGRGFYAIMKGFSGGRIQTAARALGVMGAAFDRAVEYAAQRKVFGRRVGDYALTQAKLGRMGMGLAACREFTYAVGRLMDQGGGEMEASLVKLFACKTAEWITREAMQIHGGMGYAEESAVSRYWLDARVLSIFEGAEETLALKVIGRSLVENAPDEPAT